VPVMHPITPSAICYLLGYLTGIVAFAAMAARRRLLTSGMLRVMSAAVIGGLIFALLGQWLVAGSDGKSVLGGVAGGYLTVYLYKRRIGLRRSTGDLFAVAVSAGEAVGRWGCFFAGCCYGRPSPVPWPIHQHGEWRHPTQIYLSLANATILGILLLVERKKPAENTLWFLQGTLYCVARFTIEFFRAGPVTSIGLTAAQIACALGFVFFSIGLGRLLRRTGNVVDTATSGAMA
jgi:phosphatidylglycerol:prolipoprotein diacylglycerol transferase